MMRTYRRSEWDRVLVCHGLSKTTEYRVWNGMLNRCRNSKMKEYPYYGGRGIRVCQRWVDNFTDFLADIGSRPSPKHTLDRIDPNGDYEPSNCRWATQFEQQNNRVNTRYVVYRGDRMSLANAIRISGTSVKMETVWRRIHRDGMTTEMALEKPDDRKGEVQISGKLYAMLEYYSKKEHVSVDTAAAQFIRDGLESA